jgi:hypothetical protein
MGRIPLEKDDFIKENKVIGALAGSTSVWAHLLEFGQCIYPAGRTFPIAD